MVRAAGVKVMPGLSSSSTKSQTVSVTPAYSPPEAVLVMVTNSPSESPSLTPLTVTVCSVSQFDVVNLRVGPLTVAASVSSELTVTVTVVVGWVCSFTV